MQTLETHPSTMNPQTPPRRGRSTDRLDWRFGSTLRQWVRRCRPVLRNAIEIVGGVGMLLLSLMLSFVLTPLFVFGALVVAIICLALPVVAMSALIQATGVVLTFLGLA